MKNVRMIICLLLIPVLVSVASAVPTITFTSPGLPACPHGVGADFDVLSGQIVTVQILSPDTSARSYTLSITESTTSAAGHSTAVALGALNEGFNFNNYPGVVRNSMTNAGDGTPRYMLIDRINGAINITDGSPEVPMGQVLYSFELKIPNSALGGMFTITAAVGFPVIDPPSPAYSLQINAANVTATDALILHVVPEPATIALLALGGLAFLRRKR
jgi:hypothetical protein